MDALGNENVGLIDLAINLRTRSAEQIQARYTEMTATPQTGK
jgi:hypothetical protein